MKPKLGQDQIFVDAGVVLAFPYELSCLAATCIVAFIVEYIT